MFHWVGLILLMGSGLGAAQGAPNSFKDVPNHLYNNGTYEAVEALRQRGILIGYPSGSFNGNSPISRGEVAVALNTMLSHASTQMRTSPSISLNTFKDIPRPHWAYAAWEMAITKKIMGAPDHGIRGRTAIRFEFAVFLARSPFPTKAEFFLVDLSKDKAGKWLSSHGLNSSEIQQFLRLIDEFKPETDILRRQSQTEKLERQSWAARILDSMKKEAGINAPTRNSIASNDVFNSLPHSHYGYQVYHMLLDRGLAGYPSHWQQGMSLTRYEMAVALVQAPFAVKNGARLIDLPRSKAREWLNFEGWTPDETHQFFRLVDELKSQIDELRPSGRRNPAN